MSSRHLAPTLTLALPSHPQRATWLVRPLLLTTLLLLLAACLTPVTSCPLQCQCNSHFYVYCQGAGLADEHLVDVISRVPPSAILLDLSANRISRLAGNLLARLWKLEYLSLAGNQLEDVGDHAFSNLTALRELDLRGNRIRTLGVNALSSLAGLTELHLGSNALTSLPAGVFSRQRNLRKLRLCKNTITQLKARTFSGLDSLELLNLSNNRLKSLNGLTFVGLTALKKLNLNRNALSSFHTDAFVDLSALVELDLSHNDISDLEFLFGNDFLLSLQLLMLSHNSVNNVPPEAISCNRNLRTLDLSSNRIGSIASSCFKGLQLDYLELDKNGLKEISREMFRDASRISHLDLSSNAIADIKTGAFDSFRETVLVLDLKFNSLSKVHPGMFRRMAKIRSLYLGHNRISNVEEGSFGDMTLLHDLDLSHTKLTSLARSTISGPANLRNLFLADTPLVELTGFDLDESDDRVLIEVNSSAQEVGRTHAVVTWPYKRGSQLYWKVSVVCVDPPGCPTPPHPSNLKPSLKTLTLTKLTSGHEYFVCVNPTFLSPDVTLTQCTHVHTEETQSDATTQKQGRKLDDNNSACVLHSWLFPLHQTFCSTVISTLTYLLLWTKLL